MTLLHRLASMLRWIVRRDARRARPRRRARDLRRDGCRATGCATAFAAGEARRQAILELGGVEQAKEHVRSGRHGAWLDEIGARCALRLPHVCPNPGLHPRRRADPGARHRRQHRHLRPDRRADAALAAGAPSAGAAAGAHARAGIDWSRRRSFSYADRARAGEPTGHLPQPRGLQHVHLRRRPVRQRDSGQRRARHRGLPRDAGADPGRGTAPGANRR